MANVIEAIQSECNRLRERVLPEYDKIPAGALAATMMRQSIKEAEAAIASGDVIACVRSLQDLREYSL
jgi:DNA polymerase III delta prime subunit